MSTFEQRLAAILAKPSKETYNSFKKPYDWTVETNQKRSIR